jgi:hypothetical protein
MQRTVTEYRCVYCVYLSYQRSAVVGHIEAHHARELAKERHGLQDAELRMHNVARAGVRIMSAQRLHDILAPYEAEVGSRNFGVVQAICTEVLCHALVAVGDELHSGRHYTLLSKSFRRLGR